MAGMRIDLDLGSEDTYTRPFDVMLRKLDQLEDRWKGAMGNMTGASRGIRSGGGGGAGAGGGAGSSFIGPMPIGAPPVAKPPTLDDLARYYKIQNKASGGQFADLAKGFAQSAYDYHNTQYQATGDAKHLKGMQTHSSMIGGAAPKDFMGKLKDVLYTSRMDADGNLMPLVGRMAGMIGISAVAFTVATLGVKLFAQALQVASEHAKMFTMSILAAGGNAGSAKALSGYGSALGIAPGDLARQIQSAIGSGGTASGYAAGLGINTMGGPYGDINYAAKSKKILDDIMYSKDMETAIRKSEMLGMPEMAQLQNLSPMTKKMLGSSTGMSAKDTQVFADFNAQLGIFVNHLKTLGSGLLGELLAKLNMVLTIVNAANAGMVMMWEGIMSFIKKIASWLGINMESKREDAINKNTEAVHGLRKAIEGRETMGGGARAQAAVPSGINGLNLNEAAYRAALNTGVL